MYGLPNLLAWLFADYYATGTKPYEAMDWHHIFSCPSQWIRTKDRSTVQTRHCKLIYQRHYVLRSIYKVLTSATRLTFRSLSLRVARNSLMTLLSRGSMGWGWSVIVNLTAVTTVALVSAESEATTMSQVNNVTTLVINYKTLKCKYTSLLTWVKKICWESWSNFCLSKIFDQYMSTYPLWDNMTAENLESMQTRSLMQNIFECTVFARCLRNSLVFAIRQNWSMWAHLHELKKYQWWQPDLSDQVLNAALHLWNNKAC